MLAGYLNLLISNLGQRSLLIMSTKTIITSRSSLSRGEFLRFSMLGLSGLLMPSRDRLSFTDFQIRLEPDQQGRVLDEKITIFEMPSYKAKKVKIIGGMALFLLLGRQWEMTNSRITASGTKLVRKLLPTLAPSSRCVRSSTCLITKSHLRVDWLKSLCLLPTLIGARRKGCFCIPVLLCHHLLGNCHSPRCARNPWYRLLEDKWKFILYVPAAHMRLVPNNELTPLSPHVPLNAKRLEVRIAEQTVIAYEWDEPVFMTRTATGARFRDGDYSTPIGRHLTFHKRPSRHMARGNQAANGYDLPGVPWVTYFTEQGVSIHGTYWHNDFGNHAAMVVSI